MSPASSPPARPPLPLARTPLVGRERKVAAVRGLLRRDDVPLLTPTMLYTIGEGFGLTIGKDVSTSYHNESTQPVSLLLLKLASK